MQTGFAEFKHFYNANRNSQILLLSMSLVPLSNSSKPQIPNQSLNNCRLNTIAMAQRWQDAAQAAALTKGENALDLVRTRNTPRECFLYLQTLSLMLYLASVAKQSSLGIRIRDLQARYPIRRVLHPALERHAQKRQSLTSLCRCLLARTHHSHIHCQTPVSTL